MSALLPIHAAATPEWLVDAACAAAERGLGASGALVYFDAQDGRLRRRKPASRGRRGGDQRLAKALASGLLPETIDPRRLPYVAEALDSGAPLITPFNEFFGDAPKSQVEAAALALAADMVGISEVEAAGDRLGVLLVFGDSTLNPHHLRLLAEHIACAETNLRSASTERDAPVVDVARAVFDARKLDAELQREMTRALRYKREVSICVIEATNLRLLRERFGAGLTDSLLERLGSVLAAHSREIDIIGAFKESGFTMVLTEANASGADAAASRLRAEVDNLAPEDGAVPGLELHLAVGWATCPHDGVTPEALFAAAERRMYVQAA
jgi:diguanylate cyclase (GGDEF)-like protein